MFVNNLHALPLIFEMSTITFGTGYLAQITLLKATIIECLLYFLNIVVFTTLFIDARISMNINIASQKRVKCNWKSERNCTMKLTKSSFNCYKHVGKEKLIN